MPRGGRRWKRLLFVFALVGVLALGAGGGWVVLRGRGDPGSTWVHLDRLPTDPTPLSTISLDESVDDVTAGFGTPDRFAMRLRVGAGQELRVFDRSGAERWRREDDQIKEAAMFGDDVVVGDGTVDDDEGRLMLLDGDTGAERWSTTVGTYTTMALYGDHVFLIRNGYNTFTRSAIAVYDLTTGDKIADREFDYVGPVLSSLRPNRATRLQTADFVVFDDDRMFVIDQRLEIVGEPVPAPESPAVAYMDGEILGFDGGKLIRYGKDGAQIASADFDAEQIWWLAGVEDSSWFYQSEDACGVLDFSGAAANVRWETPDCAAAAAEPVVRFGDRQPYLMLQQRSESLLLDGRSGVAVQPRTRTVASFANGYIDSGWDETTAYAMPGRQELYSVLVDRRQEYVALDGGYAIVDDGGDDIEVTVFG